MEGEKKGITRNVFFLGLVSFFTDFSSEIVFPLLPLFVKTVFGAGTVTLGAIEGLADSTAALLKLVSGKLSDYFRKRKLLAVAGYGLSTLMRPLWAAASSTWQGVAIRFADRVGKGVRTSPRDALIASSTAPETRGRAFGFQRALDHAGAVVGAGASAFLVWSFAGKFTPGESDLRKIFLIAAIPGVLAFLTLLFCVREKAPPPRPSTLRRGQGEEARVSLSGTFKFYVLIMVVFTLGNSSDIFLIWRAQNVEVGGGLGVRDVAILWAVFHVVKSVSATPGGALSDVLGRKALIIAGWVVYALVYAGFAFASSAWHVWALFCVYGLYYGLCEGTEKAFVADLVPEEARGTGYGWFNFAIGVTALPSSLVFGWVLGAAWGGPVVAFLYGAGLSALSSLLLLAFVRPGRLGRLGRPGRPGRKDAKA